MAESTTTKVDSSIRVGAGNNRESISFIVSGRGQAKVELYRNGETPALMPWMDSPSGKTDRILTNRRKIEVCGDTQVLR